MLNEKETIKFVAWLVTLETPLCRERGHALRVDPIILLSFISLRL